MNTTCIDLRSLSNCSLDICKVDALLYIIGRKAKCVQICLMNTQRLGNPVNSKQIKLTLYKLYKAAFLINGLRRANFYSSSEKVFKSLSKILVEIRFELQFWVPKGYSLEEFHFFIISHIKGRNPSHVCEDVAPRWAHPLF